MIEFFKCFRIQIRAVNALMMREICIRFGRENLGFAWTFGEALMFVIPVLVMWHYIRPRYAYGGILWADISWSGYLPLMLYRHLGYLGVNVVRQNAGLFYHRRITTFDLMYARILTEALANITALFSSLFLFTAVGEMDVPVDFRMLYIGYFYMIWFCASLSILIAGISERTRWVEKIWIPIGYMYVATGGCFYLAFWLPPTARNIALWQPSLQAYEMIRAGVFGTKIPTYYSFTYETIVLLIMTIVGLASLRSARRLVVLQ